MVVCADPRPRVVAWEWGSLRLEAGSEMGMFSSNNLKFQINDTSALQLFKNENTKKIYNVFGGVTPSTNKKKLIKKFFRLHEKNI